MVQAGQTGTGREIAAETTEVIFGIQQTHDGACDFYAEVKGRMARYGRTPDALEILPGLMVFTGRTRAYVAGARGHLTIVGSAGEVGEFMQDWFDAHACDGFNLMPPLFPHDLTGFIALATPELQRRGRVERSEAAAQ